jgi:hypothetical protein
MLNLKTFFIQCIDYIIGWIESLRQTEHDYKYVIDDIQLKTLETLPTTYIRYKWVGCRTPLYEPAIHLNNSHLFSLFRPDHAQIIVSIATIEALLHKTPAEIIECYQKYIQQCAIQFTRE